MSRRDALIRAGRAGEDLVRARLAVYAGATGAIALGGLALVVVLVLAVAGTGPGAGVSLLVVAAAAVIGGVLARLAVRRLSVISLAAFAARRMGRRRR